MSPEYVMEGTFSEKSDVFSFGVLILEIVSGRRNTSFYDVDNSALNLIGYAWELWKERDCIGVKGFNTPRYSAILVPKMNL